MYLLYLDDAGSVGNPNERYLVLAGICVFERQVYFLQEALERVAENTGHTDPTNLELHGNAIFSGRGFWRKLKREERRRIICHGLAGVRSLQGHWALFGAVVDKATVSPEDPTEYAFEQLCNRFDRFLHRLYLSDKSRQGSNGQRGLVILDKSTKETKLQALATEFRKTGHRWGTLRNFSDVPFFVDSQATRAIQYADLAAYALYRKFEKGDDEFFEVIADAFDCHGGTVHGLHHRKAPEVFCDCPGCGPRLL